MSCHIVALRSHLPVLLFPTLRTHTLFDVRILVGKGTKGLYLSLLACKAFVSAGRSRSNNHRLLALPLPPTRCKTQPWKSVPRHFGSLPTTETLVDRSRVLLVGSLRLGCGSEFQPSQPNETVPAGDLQSHCPIRWPASKRGMPCKKQTNSPGGEGVQAFCAWL